MIGKRYDDLAAGQTYATDWDWITVRKYAASEPAATVGSEIPPFSQSPTVSSTTPANGATGVTVNSPVTINWNKSKQGTAWSQPAISSNWLPVGHKGASYNVPTFDVPPPPPVTTPTIASLDRTSGYSGTTVTITGTNYGSTQGTSYVLFGTVKPTISSWSATRIGFRVPSLSRGTYQVKVVVSGVSSATKSLTPIFITINIVSLREGSG